MHAKQLFYVSASIFLLAAAYNLGVEKAESQAPNPVVAAAYMTVDTASRLDFVVVADNGDMYTSTMTKGDTPALRDLSYVGNIFAPGTVPVDAKSWSEVKQQFKR